MLKLNALVRLLKPCSFRRGSGLTTAVPHNRVEREGGELWIKPGVQTIPPRSLVHSRWSNVWRFSTNLCILATTGGHGGSAAIAGSRTAAGSLRCAGAQNKGHKIEHGGPSIHVAAPGESRPGAGIPGARP